MKELNTTYIIDVGNGTSSTSDDPYLLKEEVVREFQKALLEVIREDMMKLREKGHTTSLQDFSFKPD